MQHFALVIIRDFLSSYCLECLPIFETEYVGIHDNFNAMSWSCSSSERPSDN